MMKDILALMRPWQWAKNLFIWLPLFFALKLFSAELALRAGAAFLFFSLLSSAVYIYNDDHDREADRRHPRKKDRPLAAGRVSRGAALGLAALLLATGLVGMWFVGREAFGLSLLYMALNLLYTVRLKHLAILDVLTIAAGFVIRIFVGGFATGVKIYPWIVVMTFLLALFLALGKRREDIVIYLSSGEKTRRSVDGYTLPFIDAAMIIMASVTIVAYIMYTLSADIVAKFHTGHLYLTTLFVIVGLLRHLQIVMVEQRPADPTEVLRGDRTVQIAIVGWIVTFGLLIYLS